jgi:hypothetical protein
MMLGNHTPHSLWKLGWSIAGRSVVGDIVPQSEWLALDL